MNKKCAVFCSKGIGDGLLFMILSYNLAKAGYEVDTYHDSLHELKRFFPHGKILPFPLQEDLMSVVSRYDKVFLNLDSREKNQTIFTLLEKKSGNSFYPFKPTTCKGKAIFKDGYLDPTLSLAENLLRFCHTTLAITDSKKSPGLEPPAGLVFRKNKKRVILHPTSSDPKKNWPKKNFLRLKELLEKKGFSVEMVMSEKETPFFSELKPKTFASLDLLAAYIYESGFFIGNDSGLGHLASALHIPTLSIFLCRRKEPFWRPDFGGSSVTVKPAFWILNCKGCRLEEKYGYRTISVKKVIKLFCQLYKENL